MLRGRPRGLRVQALRLGAAQGTVAAMDLRALRISGIVASGALISAAAILAMTGAPAPRSAPAPVTPVSREPDAANPQPTALAISLRGAGPLARAQRLAMAGGRDRTAARRVQRELARQPAFRGLCFQHFSPRGDIVVRSCERGTLSVDWMARLRAMPAVTNVDPVSQLTQDRRGD